MRLPLRIGAGVGAAVLLVTLTACDQSEPPTSLQPGDLTADVLVINGTEVDVGGLTDPMEKLGKAIYFDTNLSLRKNQACASCHAPEYGFTGPIPGVNLGESVYRGSVRDRAGGLKPPSASYATFSPVLRPDGDTYVGGNFWNGRATGESLGIPAADQAIGPFLNSVEQALPDMICVVYRVATGDYADLWDAAVPGFQFSFPPRLDKECRKEGPVDYGNQDRTEIELAYGQIGLAVAAFEGSAEVNAFSSKYDAYLAGETDLTTLEEQGLELFEGKALCSECHPSEKVNGEPPLFTDFTYDNLGIPRNPLIPNDPDLGLGGFLDNSDFNGAMKVPSLRNVGKAPGNAPKAYGHNGFFKSLLQIVHFYNTANSNQDVVADGLGLPECEPYQYPTDKEELAMIGFEPACWPPPEVDQNVNREELGSLGLSAAEEEALVAFMMTLSDGWDGN